MFVYVDDFAKSANISFLAFNLLLQYIRIFGSNISHSDDKPNWI